MSDTDTKPTTSTSPQTCRMTTHLSNLELMPANQQTRTTIDCEVITNLDGKQILAATRNCEKPGTVKGLVEQDGGTATVDLKVKSADKMSVSLKSKTDSKVNVHTQHARVSADGPGAQIDVNEGKEGWCSIL